MLDLSAWKLSLERIEYARACKSMQKDVRDIQPDQSHHSPNLDVNFPIDDRSYSRMSNCHMIRGYNGRSNVKNKKEEWHSALAISLAPCSLTTLVSAIAMHVIGVLQGRPRRRRQRGQRRQLLLSMFKHTRDWGHNLTCSLGKVGVKDNLAQRLVVGWWSTPRHPANDGVMTHLLARPNPES